LLTVAPTSEASTLPLTGRAVLVTGGSSGIGRAIALAAARAGADVALTYRSNEAGAREVEREIAALGPRALVLRLDLADVRAIRSVGRSVAGAFGRIDAWINNAGADILTGSAAGLPILERLDLLMRVDLRGTMVASWEAAEVLGAQDEGGVIINMSWDHVITGMAGVNPQLFAAVKGGVLAFSKSLARTVAPRVRVNVIAPGWIETSFGAGVDERMYRSVADATPLKRWGTPEDVAGAAVFLASPAASFLTGETIHVGGGIVM
jgi:3-oxoacyl-[acyl-carrier protein] reductase